MPEQAVPSEQVLPRRVDNGDVSQAMLGAVPGDEPKKKKGLAALIIAVLVVILVVAGFVLFKVFNSAPDKADVQKGLE